MALPQTVAIKVFLLDWPDVRAPRGFTTEWVERLLFGTTPHRVTPDAHAHGLDETAHQYFHGETDGRVRLRGEVVDWVTSAMLSRDVPHWNDATMQNPFAVQPPGSPVLYGGGWPVVVAESLRLNHLVGQAFKTTDDLHRSVRRLSDGTLADKLLFLYADVTTGGAKREFARMPVTLDRMSARNNTGVRVRPDNGQPWSTLWDEGWAGLPDMAIVPLVTADLPGRRADGTYAPPDPDPSTLRMHAFSVILHELGHLVSGLPDTYNEPFTPWGNHCLMGGPTVATHHHVPFSSYARHRSGALTFDDRPRGRQRVFLRPYEAQNHAVRLTNGLPGSERYIALTNRLSRAHTLADPPVDSGRGALVYRWDPRGRTRLRWDAETTRKITAVIRSGGGSGNDVMLWGPGEQIPGVSPRGTNHHGPGTLRNGLGELWYTVDAIAEDRQDVVVDLGFHAVDLLGDFHLAQWTGIAARQLPAKLVPDRFGGSAGHAMLQDGHPAVGGDTGRSLVLRPRWASPGILLGRYPLTPPVLGAPWTLYARVGMDELPDGSDGVVLWFSLGKQSHAMRLVPGEVKDVAIDFANGGTSLEVRVESEASHDGDRVYLLHGWLVPDAPREVDLLAVAHEATWSSSVGSVTFGIAGYRNGEARWLEEASLHTGTRWLGRSLTTAADWSPEGFIQGVWEGVKVPANGGFLRGVLAWSGATRVTDRDVQIEVKWRLSGTVDWSLLAGGEPMAFEQSPAKGPDLEAFELVLPGGSYGRSIDVLVRVGTNGTSGPDAVVWTKLAVTTA